MRLRFVLLTALLLTVPMLSQDNERLARIEEKLDQLQRGQQTMIDQQKSFSRTIYGHESSPGLKSQIELNTQFRQRAENIVLALITLIIANVVTLTFQAIRYYQTRKDAEHGTTQ